MTFGEYLKKIRIEKGYSLRRLATASDVSHPYLYDVENNKRNPLIGERLEKIARELKLRKNETITFYDLAAKQHGKLPYDIEKVLKKNKSLQKKIRKMLK